MNNYMKCIIVFSSSVLFIICLASYLIDPYGVYILYKDSFPRKVAAADKGRTVKPYQVLNTSPFTLLVGNSRVEIGMPDEHPFYQGKPVYNMGLPGASINMQYSYALYSINNNSSVKQVVISVDFLDFTSREEEIILSPVDQDWRWRLKGFSSESFADIRRYTSERISMLFSQSAIFDSIKTVAAQKSNVNSLNRFGFNDGRLYHFHVKNEGFGALYRQKEQELDKRLSSQNLVFTEKSYHLRTLEKFINELIKKEIKVYLFINPYQYPYLNKLSQYNLDSHFENWKIQLAKLAARYNLNLYDFAIYSPIVTETIVSPSSKNIDHSKYFWEPSHYRPALGELILFILQHGDCAEHCEIK